MCGIGCGQNNVILGDIVDQNKHAYDLGLSDKTIRIIQKDLDGKVIGKFKSLREAERITGCYSSRISEVINGKTKTNIHKNYIWEKEEIV